jgi:hypothetical protein
MTQITTLMEPIYITHKTKRNQTKNQLDMKIIDAIDESLASFGESVKSAVYFQLENGYNVKKQDIPSRIEEFATAIEAIFGIGARLIEMKIIETLYASAKGFMYIPKSEDLVFKDYVQSVKSFLMSSVTN